LIDVKRCLLVELLEILDSVSCIQRRGFATFLWWFAMAAFNQCAKHKVSWPSL